MNKIFISKNPIRKNIILILVLTMLASSLCGCSMIFGETMPIDEERVTKTANGLSFELPENYPQKTLQLSNGTTASVWVNDPDDIKFSFHASTGDADLINIEQFNWIATGYFSGQVTYMGQTITLSPDIINPSVKSADEIEVNGNKCYKTKVVYDFKESSSKITNTTELIYIMQIDDILVYLVFSTRTNDFADYEPLIDVIVNSFKKA